jgi:thiamine kinase-like enzyme
MSAWRRWVGEVGPQIQRNERKLKELESILLSFGAGRQALATGIACETVSGGAINRTIRVTSVGVDWAVRLAGPGDDALLVSRVGERDAQAAAAALGFAPAVVYADPALGVLVSQWLPAANASAALFDSEAGLSRLARRVRDLHDSPLPAGLRPIDADSVARDYLSAASAGSGPVSRRLLQDAVQRSESRRRSERPAFCHNDLHALNVLDGENLWFIDWEYAGCGDPLFELAGIIGYHNLSPRQSAALLASYGGVEVAEITPWLMLFDAVHALWLDVAHAWHTLPEVRRAALIQRLGS